ncbi:MAG: glucosylglycerol-phosphate synthase [Rhodobiaceae bacterium]|nr:glucosylglycerol-phosphate synthase [Rhodobiaceae bacterium]MCC0056607.1 glucosylglycerol-phosphate synthase [Rhodobiaceae bacterium]
MSARKSDLVIVYHRQPYEEVIEDGVLVRRENKSPNGIVPTLKSFFGHVDQGSWIAWKEASDPERPEFDRVVEISDAYGDYRVSRLPLTAEQVRSFYHVTSKEALWPVLHAFRERYNYDPVDWPTFREVNFAFAQAAAREASDDATIWVHDYNLWLVPEYLRQMKPNAKIGFFHHTPFPGPDVFNILPWRYEIVGSLLKCDVVGFHIPRFAQNFVAVSESLFDVSDVERKFVDMKGSRIRPALSELKAPTSLVHEGRKVGILATPVGIDVNYVEDCAATAETTALEKRIEEELDGKRLVLSVSRTDYTKGGAELLYAYERLLERRTELHGKVRLMFVSVAANNGMAVYEQVQQELEGIAGRINAQFARFDWQPVHLLSTPIPFKELVAFYRQADVCWITPLADGLNLVAKEFAAARTDGDGVLVLSEFAGVAVELPQAVLCNPFSARSMDHTIDQALDMPEEERRLRMSAMRGVTRDHTIGDWAEDLRLAFSNVDGQVEFSDTRDVA